MKNIFSLTKLICLLAIITLTAASCRKNNSEPPHSTTKNYIHTGFKQVVAGEQFEITITKAAAFSITAVGSPEDIADLIMDTTVAGYLEVSYVKSKNNRYKMKVHITMPMLTGVYFHGQAVGNVTGFDNGTRMEANISSQATCNIEVKIPYLELFANAQAVINVSGRVPKTDMTTTGQANIHAYLLDTDTATTTAAGQSNIDIHAHTKLDADASGQSTIHYRGTPNTHFITSGQARIIKE